jgi:hypothetical protein
MAAPLTNQPRSAEVSEFLVKLKNTPSAGGDYAARGRLILAIDATASRSQTWDAACAIQGEMFEATSALGRLDVQLVYYRAFDECRASKWLSSASELHRVMGKVSCEGGETQIRRVLDHAIRETGKRKVGALVFVGDSLEEDVDLLCRLAGELGALGVPIFLLQEGHNAAAEAAFKQMADLSHGAYLAFDLAGIDRLKILLAAIAVFATGGHQALSEYGKQKGGDVLRIGTSLRRGKGPR